MYDVAKLSGVVGGEGLQMVHTIMVIYFHAVTVIKHYTVHAICHYVIFKLDFTYCLPSTPTTQTQRRSQTRNLCRTYVYKVLIEAALPSTDFPESMFFMRSFLCISIPHCTTSQETIFFLYFLSDFFFCIIFLFLFYHKTLKVFCFS